VSTDREALENAVLAIDGCVNTLIMARIILTERLDATSPAPGAAQETQPEGCAHSNLMDVHPGVQLCADCGENFGADRF
jgi:hypothetical protein